MLTKVKAAPYTRQVGTEENTVLAVPILDPGAKKWWGDIRHSLVTLLPAKRHGYHCKERCLGTCLDGCGKSRSHRGSKLVIIQPAAGR